MNLVTAPTRRWQLFIAAGIAIIITLLSCSISAAQAQEYQGQQLLTKGGSGRIISGQPAEDFPGIAALVARRQPDAYQGHFCGAALISKYWLLTAAHCVTKHSNNYVDAVIGRPNLNQRRGQRHAIQQVYIHPRFDPRTVSYDFALLRLATPSTVRPLSAIYRRPISAGKKLTVAGWGVTEYDEMPTQLQQTTVYSNKQHRCRRIYQADQSMFCAARRGHDSCQGDSGGPIVGQVGGQVRLFGLVSKGHGCAKPGYPGVYSRPGLVYNWIKKQTRVGQRGKLRYPGKEVFPAVPTIDYGPLEYAELSSAVVDRRFDAQRYYRHLSFWTRKKFPIKTIQLQFSIPVCRLSRPYDPSVIPENGTCQLNSWQLSGRQRKISFHFYTTTKCLSYRAELILPGNKEFIISEPSCPS